MIALFIEIREFFSNSENDDTYSKLNHWQVLEPLGRRFWRF